MNTLANTFFESAAFERAFVNAIVRLVREEMPDASLGVVADVLTVAANALREIAAERSDGEVLQ